MDDIAEKINSILNDPASLEQIKTIAGMLGGAQSQEAKAQSPIPTSTSSASSAVPDLASIMQFAPLLNMFKAEDDTTRFLSALRPLLSAERQKKLDEVIKILRLIKLFPLIKSSGILSSLF
jgi:hypothetical protein